MRPSTGVSCGSESLGAPPRPPLPVINFPVLRETGPVTHRGALGGGGGGDWHWLTLVSPHRCHWQQLRWEITNLAQSYYLGLSKLSTGLHTCRLALGGKTFCSTLRIQCCKLHTNKGLFGSQIISSELWRCYNESGVQNHVHKVQPLVSFRQQLQAECFQT